jgi:hypothetical protein
MVKPTFQDLPVDFWVFPGKLGTTEPSLCFYHNKTEVGREILDALVELDDAKGPARRTLTFHRCSRPTPLLTLKFAVVPEREDLKVMNISRENETATIEMTDRGLRVMIDAITSWLGGAEDFGISADASSLKRKQLGKLDLESIELWFWGPGYHAP